MKKEILSLHFAVMLFGLAGVIGKFVSLPAILVTLGRVFFSALFLLVIILFKRESIKLKRRDYLIITLAAITMAVHWFTFLQSIQVATVAIGTITFATFPLFVTFLEPLIYHERLELKNVVIALLMLFGVILTVPEFSLGNQMTVGIVIGMISSFSYAVLCLFNRYLSSSYHGSVVCFYEQMIATIVLLPAFFIVKSSISSIDLIAIIFMGIVCTAIAHTIYINSLKKVKVQTAGIISGMESIYSIIFAFILLHETLNTKVLLGGLVILMTSLYASVKKDA
ncbi:DMT family transporter [uncultured Thomasclavelia sp.]|uniref:DMT family transporter n=1 Tax=uncultured Thomasclavelia sp. TaxID=3025759 RepID=UPI0025DE842F|nr:DMT family transporter [uncultured Thomasclavelia sp.]